MSVTSITRKKMKNGNQSFTAKINGRVRKVAEAKPWKSGFSINKYTVDGHVSYNSPVKTYDADELNIIVQSWVEQITETDAVIN